jgi:fatty acid desaturase
MAIKHYIDPAIVKKYSHPEYLHSLSMIAFDWIAIFTVIAICQYFFNPFTYIVAVMLIANRQHGLLILMHDSSHFRFSTNRKLNDITGELLTAWPLFIRMKAYREKHMQHHQFANTDKDPDFRKDRYLKTRKEVLIALLRDGLALNTLGQLEEIKRLKTNTSRNYKLARLGFYLSLAITLTAFGLWKLYLLYWIVPAFTWLKVCLRLRAIADHTGVQNREQPFDTRTVVPSWFDRLFLAPHGCSYHIIHHGYAAVPCHRLKKLHGIMMQHPEVPGKAHITYGFHNLILEFPKDISSTEQQEKRLGLSFSANYPTN